MPEIVPVVLDGAERYTAKAVDFEDVLGSGGRSDNKYVRLFTNANLVAGAVEGFVFHVGVKGEVIEATVGKAVPIVW